MRKKASLRKLRRPRASFQNPRKSITINLSEAEYRLVLSVKADDIDATYGMSGWATNKFLRLMKKLSRQRVECCPICRVKYEQPDKKKERESTTGLENYS